MLHVVSLEDYSMAHAHTHADTAYLQAKRHAYQLVTTHKWADAARGLSQLSGDHRFEANDWLSLAIANVHAGALPAATDAARRAVAHDPRHLRALQVLTISLLEQNRWHEAAAVFEQQSDNAEAQASFDFLVNQGTTMWHLKRHHEALDAFLKAMAIDVADASLHFRLGLVLKDMKDYNAAAESFLTTLALQPSRLSARLMAIHMRQYACDWRDFDASCTAALEAIQELRHRDADAAEGATFALLGVPHPPALFRMVAEQAANFHSGQIQPLPPQTRARDASGRIRIGYLSCDFHNHATAQLFVEALEHRNTRDFEVTLYSYGKDDNTPMQHRVRRACDQFVDMRTMDTRTMAQRIHADGIDVLVELKGHTQDSRLSVLAYRPAPVQVSFLGFPATTGMRCIDYFIGDAVTTPLSHAAHYTECIAQMPHCYQPNDSQRTRPAPSDRLQWGLPKHALVLGCFNQSFKLTPDTFGAWMHILQAVPNAMLWLLHDNPQATANLRLEAKRHGVDPDRLIFAPKASVSDHLARLPLADLMLDNWPCNAHTTASDALWMGVPLATVIGETFASRVAASLLTTVGLDELVFANASEYEAGVISLLQQPERLQGMRARLERERSTSPLFDGARFANDLESLYRRMVERSRAGLAPEVLAAAG
ncbi:MAG: glycosyltransferase [Burkholderiales bacterium PBB1]|nr:MAG: glycosyltransferase [Burkholderiales bacterium PBB1]